MNHATGARVLCAVVDALRELLRGVGTPGVEGVKQWSGWVAVRADAHDAVPEGVHGHGGRFQSLAAHLFADAGNCACGDAGQFVGIDFPAAIGGGVGAVGTCEPKTFSICLPSKPKSSVRAEELPTSRVRIESTCQL